MKALWTLTPTCPPLDVLALSWPLPAEEPPAEEDRFDPAGINLRYEEPPEDVFKPKLNNYQQLKQAQQRQSIEQALRAFERGSLQTWEVYAGPGNLSAAFQALGHETMKFDINNGWDFTKREHQKQFLALQTKLCPRFVWIAPPCRKWSPMQRLNAREPWQKDLLQAERDVEENAHLRFSRKVFKNQLDAWIGTTQTCRVMEHQHLQEHGRTLAQDTS